MSNLFQKWWNFAMLNHNWLKTYPLFWDQQYRISKLLKIQIDYFLIGKNLIKLLMQLWQIDIHSYLLKDGLLQINNVVKFKLEKHKMNKMKLHRWRKYALLLLFVELWKNLESLQLNNLKTFIFVYREKQLIWLGQVLTFKYIWGWQFTTVCVLLWFLLVMMPQ